MMGLKIIVLALTLVDAARYECLNIDDVDRAAKQQFCDDISADISEDNQQVERLKFYGRAGPGWTAKMYPFSFINPRRMWPHQEWEQESRSGGTMDFDNGNLGTFLSRRIEDCVWWKGALVHKDLFPVEDVMTYDPETKTRTFEPIPSWVKNYFSQWSGGDMRISTTEMPRMIKHWDANITGLMRDDDPEAFWSHWINGRMPMFSKAHDKIVYDILKEPACNFKTYKTVAEWASQGPDLDGANVCNFRQRDWRTVCRDPTFNSYCPWYAISYSGFKTYSADHAKMKIREPSSASDLGSAMYAARYNQIFGQAFGRGMDDLNAPRLNKFTSGYYTPEEFFQKFIDEQQYVTGSVKTWPAQREAGDHWQMSFERSKLDHWAGMVEGEPWTGENMGFVDALRKHKKTLIGKSNDIFHQDECGSGATTIIMSTLTLLIMLF